MLGLLGKVKEKLEEGIRKVTRICIGK